METIVFILYILGVITITRFIIINSIKLFFKLINWLQWKFKILLNKIKNLFDNNNEVIIITEVPQKKYKYYIKKNIMTDYEKYFYNIFLELENEYNVKVQPQINLASIIKKVSNDNTYLDLYKNIDFGIFTKNYQELLLLIEINDKTHNLPHRKIRDEKVRKICEEAEIKLISFYSNYPNNKEYVKNRILKELNFK